MPQPDYIQSLRSSLKAASPPSPFICSGVIVPLVAEAQGAAVVLELRAGHLARSPGEVGFPGGRVEPGESPWQAALRELEEELGVPAAQVELLGRLPEQQRRPEELVFPFVCSLAGAARIRPRAAEVAEVFTVPLDDLLRRGFREARIIEEHTLSEDFPSHRLPNGGWRRSLERPVYYLDYGQYLIWGLTASILMLLLEQLRGPAQASGKFG